MIPLLCGGIFYAQHGKQQPKFDFPATFKKISDAVLPKSHAYDNLRELCTTIGPRMAGSKAYANAVQWAEQKLAAAGAEQISRQDVKVRPWKRGLELVQFSGADKRWRKLAALGLGGSVGTEGKDLEAKILVANNMSEFNALSLAQVKGKVVFFNYTFDQNIVNPAEEYLNAGKYRWSAASVASKKGAVAVLSRSATTALDDLPHTGSMYYDELTKNKIPALSISSSSADLLAAAAAKQDITVKINSTSGPAEETIDQNIYADIPGTKDQQVILVAAHLDTWDISEGAHDDGAGTVQVIEVLRVLKEVGYVPRHRLRFILFANEENGVSGGETYAAAVKKSGEKHLLAIESDAGGYTPRGISLDMIPERRRLIAPYHRYFLPFGIYDFTGQTSGQDIAPLKKLGVPLAELAPDMQRYFDLHHSAADTFDKVNRRELNLGAVALAQFVIMIDQTW